MNNTPSNSAVFSDDEVTKAVVMMSVVLVIGCIGNAVVIIVLCLKGSAANSWWNRHRRRHHNGNSNIDDTATFGRDKTLDFFILVLAVSDLLVCVIIIPATITMELYQFRISFDIMCKLFYVLFVTNTTFSSLLISAVALDRYLFICHSLKQILTLLKAKVLVSTLALFSLGVGIAAGSVVSVKEIVPSTFESGGLSGYICEENEYVRGISDLHKTFSQIIKYVNHGCYLSCILIVLVLYSFVFWAIVTSRSRRNKFVGQLLSQKEGDHNNGRSPLHQPRTPRQRKVLKIMQKAQFTLQNLRSALMLFIIALVYIFTFVPALVIANGWAQVNLVFLYLYYVNSAANPCIYVMFTPSFRQILATVIGDCLCVCKANNSGGRPIHETQPIVAMQAQRLISPKSVKTGETTKTNLPLVSRANKMTMTRSANKETSLVAHLV